MKDWRGVPLKEGQQVVWVHHSGNSWWPRVGHITKLNEDKGTVQLKRELTEEDFRWSWRKPSGVSVLPAERVTVVLALPPAGDDVTPPYE